MKSFTKKILVTALLLSSTSALASFTLGGLNEHLPRPKPELPDLGGFGGGFGGAVIEVAVDAANGNTGRNAILPGLPGGGNIQVPVTDKDKYQNTKNLAFSTEAKSVLKFENKSAGAQAYDANVRIKYLRKDVNSGDDIVTFEVFTLKPTEGTTITLNGSDTYVQVDAKSTKTGEQLLKLNLCAYNNEYYRAPGSELAPGGTRKDIAFHGEFGPPAVSYFTYGMEKDGYKDLKIEELECWTTYPQE